MILLLISPTKIRSDANSSLNSFSLYLFDSSIRDENQDSNWRWPMAKREHFSPKVAHFRRRRQRKIGLNDTFLGTTGAENFENLWWFCEKSPSFVKIEYSKLWIWNCFYRLFFEIFKVTHFSKIPILRWPKPHWPLLNSRPG